MREGSGEGEERPGGREGKTRQATALISLHSGNTVDGGTIIQV